MKRISVFLAPCRNTSPSWACPSMRGLTFAELLRRAIEQFLKAEKE